MIKILHLEDSGTDIELIERELRKSDIHFEKKVVADKAGFEVALQTFAPEIILADHSLPSFNSFEALDILKRWNISIPFILITAYISEEFAVTVMKAGAWDFILKDRLQRLPSAILNALAKCIAEKENKEYLRQVIANEALLKETEKLAHIGSWTSDLIMQKVFWSEEMYHIYAYQPGEIVPSFDLFMSHIHPDDRDIVRENMENALSGRPYKKLTFKMHDSKGRVRYIQAALQVTRNEKAEPVKLNGFNQDVTEMKLAEQSLQASETLLKEAQRMAGMGSWQLDWPENKLVFSDQAYRVFGINQQQTEGLHASVLDAIHPEDLSFARELFRQSLREKKPYDTSYRIILKDGTLKYLHVKCEFFAAESGGTVHSIGTVQDITARTLAEQAIRESESKLEIKNKELERKNKELEQFAFVSSHDLQEPLATMASFAGLLQQEYNGKLDEQADRALAFIAQSAGRMKTLIKDLLDYSRIGIGMSREEVDCNHILVETLEDLGKPIRDTKAIIQVGPLPVVTGYPSGLRQLFQNMISNAIKFSKKDHVPEIYISAESAGEWWEFTFRDNGIGIDPVFHEKIFIIFQRLHNRSEYEGSGIGLAHCKKIVELHKGNIRVESAVDQGATFYFTIQRDIKNEKTHVHTADR